MSIIVEGRDETKGVGDMWPQWRGTTARSHSNPRGSPPPGPPPADCFHAERLQTQQQQQKQQQQQQQQQAKEGVYLFCFCKIRCIGEVCALPGIILGLHAEVVVSSRLLLPLHPCVEGGKKAAERVSAGPSSIGLGIGLRRFASRVILRFAYALLIDITAYSRELPTPTVVRTTNNNVVATTRS
ncbi:hypothetical protein ACSSS7_001680 [Eimeria intestinalis]